MERLGLALCSPAFPWQDSAVHLGSVAPFQQRVLEASCPQAHLGSALDSPVRAIQDLPPYLPLPAFHHPSSLVSPAVASRQKASLPSAVLATRNPALIVSHLPAPARGDSPMASGVVLSG